MPVIPPVLFDDFCNQAATCDLVLWGGNSVNSTGVEIMSNSIYSHATMVIVEPVTGHRYLYQCVTEELEPDPLVGNKTHSGVQAGALRKTMLNLSSYHDVPTWRPYAGANQHDPTFIQSVWSAATSLDGIPFPSVPWGMVQLFIEGRYEGIEKTSPLFCSGLVALMLKRLGILDQTVPCNAYFPKDLSSLYPGHMNVISGGFGVDTNIEMPAQSTKALAGG
jgi:hypothetical protein